MIIRTALETDIAAIADIYEEIHAAEESGAGKTGWVRAVYPTRQTAEAALQRGDLFVAEDGGTVAGAAIINRQQVDVYHGAGWRFPAQDSEVMVLHTLVISPKASGKGRGEEFVHFYEEYARSQGCHVLRMDTNAINCRARTLYQRLGYREADIVPCVFNGIEGVRLVLLEKRLD